ncbi:unnamed protein product [Didymodactylos carnosus]|uniref:D-alanyl-D-alanine carboxypeptidase-like core domain-containing protein n=1 Tax=Didymodactylos carnosus TaxID=1234261 RepID=A0A814D7N1_9BILA|nr:unnamed protein product [Didymodactylos carnosus]CAF1305808.1 unnamed protein product [Didymodactylos carnosus]CAF3728768.1 unnamed protein product [Didymodactylos carnosus]CAF4112935.1 unnamed protein product [Didymodactylos carnosus]
MSVLCSPSDCHVGGYTSQTANSLPITLMKGNDDVEYSVVKILQEHLSDPASYSLSPYESDNTMTITTACSYDKIRTAALRDGVAIKISSGFRVLARQQYFYDCYITQQCNDGNFAAVPGTSNHGTGIALDLNTNCGKQTDEKPPAECQTSDVYQWLYENGHNYGFVRTVKSEPWHWEYRGIGVQRPDWA